MTGTLTDDDLRALLAEAAGLYAVPERGPHEVLSATREPGRADRRLRLLAAAAAGVVLVGGVALFQGRQDRVGQLAGSPRPVAAPSAGAGSAGAPTYGKVASGAPQVQYEAMQSGPEATARDRLTLRAAAPAAAPVPAAPAPAAARQLPVAVDGARVVKKGAIALLVGDGEVTPTLTRVQGFAAAAGGLVASGQTEESGSTPSGSVTLRVPVGRFEQVVAQVRGTGAQVRSASTSGQDVTAQYADLQAQLRTLTAARERFLAILSRASSIGDVLSVQQRVDDVTGRLDRLEGQRRVLAAQSDSATLEVTVSERADAVVARRAPNGLVQALHDAGRGFATGVEGLVRLSGRGALLLLCLAVVWALARAGWRLTRRRLV